METRENRRRGAPDVYGHYGLLRQFSSWLFYLLIGILVGNVFKHINTDLILSDAYEYS